MEKAEDMTFVFHNGEGDSDERVIHEGDLPRAREVGEEPRWRIFRQLNGQYVNETINLTV